MLEMKDDQVYQELKEEWPTEAHFKYDDVFMKLIEERNKRE